MYYYFYELSGIPFYIGATDKHITQILFEKDETLDAYEEKETSLIEQAKNELIEFLDGQRDSFTLPIQYPYGTEFQRKVWDALLTIPYGEVCSYKDIAIKAENPKAYRAVGMANNKNPISVVVP